MKTPNFDNDALPLGERYRLCRYMLEVAIKRCAFWYQVTTWCAGVMILLPVAVLAGAWYTGYEIIPQKVLGAWGALFLLPIFAALRRGHWIRTLEFWQATHMRLDELRASMQAGRDESTNN